MEIGANTRLLAIIGDPVTHSLSPAMHNAAYRALGLDAVYVALRSSPSGLPALLAACAATGAAGNITVPYKEAAERCLARKTELCERVGACNTFWSEGGELVGDNTDVGGVLAALKALGVDGAARWLVIGTGGAARAVAIAATQARAELTVASRAPDRAAQFVAWARSRGANAEPARRDAPPESEVAINTTPLGLQPSDPVPLEPSAAPRLRAALDMVYARGETRWVRQLRAAGVHAQDGREMLLQQGVAAFGRFFPGAPAPVEVMRAALARALRA
jgi:shikimate dehydrogenase